MACIVEDPGNCCRNLLSDVFTERDEESSLVRLRVIHVADLGHLKSQLYLIFKTSPWTDYIEAAPVPAGGKTNSDQAPEKLHASF